MPPPLASRLAPIFIQTAHRSTTTGGSAGWMSQLPLWPVNPRKSVAILIIAACGLIYRGKQKRQRSPKHVDRLPEAKLTPNGTDAHRKRICERVAAKLHHRSGTGPPSRLLSIYERERRCCSRRAVKCVSPSYRLVDALLLAPGLVSPAAPVRRVLTRKAERSPRII